MAEEYERAAELKARADELHARLAEPATRRRGRRDRRRREPARSSARPTSPPSWPPAPASRSASSSPASSSACTRLEEDLHRRVIGQEEAVELVADTVRRARVGLAEGDRPLGTFLFLGPTGVGKTELVKALAERLFATEKALVRIDMSEYREPHTVARLIGSPPGYVGYGDGGQLSEPVRRRPYSVILLDEIEKAHPDVWNVLLQVMDDGRLTDGEGRTVDFSNTVLVMTSNLGAAKAKRVARVHGRRPGGRRGAHAVRREAAFLPEFLNRIDEIVTFSPLTVRAGRAHQRAAVRADRRAAARRARDHARGGRRARLPPGPRGLRRGVRRPPAEAPHPPDAREGADPRDPRRPPGRRRDGPRARGRGGRDRPRDPLRPGPPSASPRGPIAPRQTPREETARPGSVPRRAVSRLRRRSGRPAPAVERLDRRGCSSPSSPAAWRRRISAAQRPSGKPFSIVKSSATPVSPPAARWSRMYATPPRRRDRPAAQRPRSDAA